MYLTLNHRYTRRLQGGLHVVERAAGMESHGWDGTVWTGQNPGGGSIIKGKGVHPLFTRWRRARCLGKFGVGEDQKWLAMPLAGLTPGSIHCRALFYDSRTTHTVPTFDFTSWQQLVSSSCQGLGRYRALQVLWRCVLKGGHGQYLHHHHHQSLNREGRWGTTWFYNQFSPFFPVLHCPLGPMRVPSLRYSPA